MADITGLRQRPQAGDWVWLVCTEYAKREPMAYRPAGADEQPTHVRVYGPASDEDFGADAATVAIRGHGTQGNGHSWTWDESQANSIPVDQRRAA